MFERYTEKARRAIFFARYEAAQSGSPYIETEHLLLGLMHDDRSLVRRFLPNASYEQFRAAVDSFGAKFPKEKLSTAVDLPLTNECKRVLVHAGEEADALGHRHIGTEHLLLSLAHCEHTVAADILAQHGFNASEARLRIAVEQGGDRPAALSGSTHRLMSSTESIQLHGKLYPLTHVILLADWLRLFAWEQRPWTPRDILVDLRTNRPMFFTGQEYDSSAFKLVERGWTRDACLICHWELTQSQDPLHGTGYTNGRDWLCQECHDRLIAPHSGPPGAELYT